jgi:cobalamin synthase
MDNSADKTGGNWWVSKSRETRTWIFLAAVWFVLGMVVVLVFDPADYHGWSALYGKQYFNHMNDTEVVHLSIILGLPLIAWLLRRLYLRFVVSPASQEGPGGPAS